MAQFLVPRLQEWKAKRATRALAGLDVDDISAYYNDDRSDEVSNYKMKESAIPT